MKKRSQEQKVVLENREKIEKFLLWEPGSGTSIVWYDNCTNTSFFIQDTEIQTRYPLSEIGIFQNVKGWGFDLMKYFISESVIEYVKNQMNNVKVETVKDRIWQTKTNSAKFTIKSAWEMLRKKKDNSEDIHASWCKSLSLSSLFLFGGFDQEKFLFQLRESL